MENYPVPNFIAVVSMNQKCRLIGNCQVQKTWISFKKQSNHGARIKSQKHEIKDRHIQWWTRVNWMSEWKIKDLEPYSGARYRARQKYFTEYQPHTGNKLKKKKKKTLMSAKTYLKPHHEGIGWQTSLCAAESTLVQKPVPQPKFGDSTTSDCGRRDEKS